MSLAAGKLPEAVPTAAQHDSSATNSNRLPVSTHIALPEILERHFSVQTLAELWGLSTDAIRDLFENEPGVLTLGARTSGRKRKYVTLRIPESVAARVYKRMTSSQD